MAMQKLYWYYLLLLLSVFATPAIAQKLTVAVANPVEATLSAARIVKGVDGKETVVPAEKIAPGDLIEYQTSYKNNTKATIRSLVAALPLPEGTTYVPGSAKPANVQASLDGKIFAVMPLKRMVKTADNKIQEQLVPYSEYRALKWTIGELPVSATGLTVSARVRVDSVTSAVVDTGKAK